MCYAILTVCLARGNRCRVKITWENVIPIIFQIYSFIFSWTKFCVHVHLRAIEKIFENCMQICSQTSRVNLPRSLSIHKRAMVQTLEVHFAMSRIQNEGNFWFGVETPMGTIYVRSIDWKKKITNKRFHPISYVPHFVPNTPFSRFFFIYIHTYI